MSTKSKDLYYDVDALDTVKKKVSSLHGNYIVTGPASDADNVHASGTKIRNILNSLDNYDDSYDNCFSKYDLSSKANIIYNKSQLFLENWLDFDEAFVTSYKLLGDSTTTATTILNEFEGMKDNSSTTPRINSPYDYANWLKKKKGKDSKEYENYMKLLHPDEKKQKTNAKNSKKGAKSKVSEPADSNTGAKIPTNGLVVLPFHPSSPSNNNNNDNNNNNNSSKSEDELKKKEEKLRKKEEELQHKEREQSDRESALDTREKQLKEKEAELKKKEEQLKEKEAELKAREEELKKKEQDSVTNPTNPDSVPKPEEKPSDPVVEPGDDVYEPPKPVDTQPAEQQPSTQVNNSQQNNSYQAPVEQANTDYSNQNVTVTPNDASGDSSSGNQPTPPTQEPIVADPNVGDTPDLFGEPDSKDPDKGGVVPDLPDNSSSSSSSSSTKNSKGFNPVPLAVGLGAAALGGVGVKAYKSHKENSDFDDVNEDSFTNGNRFWSDEEPNTIHTEQNELSGEDLLKEQTTAPSYEAMSNGNNDTWSIEDDSQDGSSDNQTLDLLS